MERRRAGLTRPKVTPVRAREEWRRKDHQRPRRVSPAGRTQSGAEATWRAGGGAERAGLSSRNDYYREYIDRAEGREPRELGTVYWD